MAQQAKKTTRTQSPSHAHPIGDVPNKIFEMERDGTEKLMRTADSLSHVAMECTGICSENIGALVEYGNTAARVSHETGNKIVESCNRAFSDCTEISKEVVACRNISDMAELQNKAIQQITDNYFSTTNILCSLWLNNWNEALELLGKHTAAASKQAGMAFTNLNGGPYATRRN